MYERHSHRASEHKDVYSFILLLESLVHLSFVVSLTTADA
jgi:hypothetical protein